MSCFVRIATKLTDLDTVKKSIADIGYVVREHTSEVRGWNDDTISADLVIGTDTEYDIGAVKTKDGTYELVADWGMAHVDQQGFVNKLSQAYSRQRVLQVAQRTGFVVAKDQLDQQRGTRHLVLRKFV